MNAAIAELAQLDQWVISKPVERRGKIDKPPFSPHTKRMCSHSNPADWSSYDDAGAALASFSWRGFVFHDADPYSGIDVDGCAKPGIEQIRTRDDIEDWALPIIDQANSYTEVSPSGKGVKIWVRGKLADAIKHSLGEHKGIEVYSRQRYFTVTGRHLAGTPTEIRDGQSVLDQLQRDYAPKVEPTIQTFETSKPSHRPPGRLQASDTIAHANRTNDLGSYLESKGASLVRTAGDTRYYSGIAGEKHTHTFTYIVSPAKDGAGHIAFSYSPNGKLNNVDFRRGFRFFDAYLVLDAGGDKIAALKAFSPTRAPRQKRQDPPLIEPQIRIRTSEQIADANRKRAERCAAALATLADVQARASQDDELSKADRAVLDALIEIAGGRSWCRPSKDQIATVSTYSIGSVKRSLMTLEARGYFRSSGKGGPAGSNRTAIRTFVCGSFSGEMIHESIVKIDSIQTLEAYERAPEAQPRGAADTLDEWEACEPDFNPADLAWLYAQEWEPTPAPESSGETVSPPKTTAEITPVAPTDQDPAGGASYNPKLDHTAPRRRRAKQSPTERAAAAKARRQARWRDMDAPELRRNLIILSRKADKTTHPAQRYALKEQCAEIEHYLALKDAQLDAELALVETAAPVPPPHKLAPEGRLLTMAMNFSQALAPAGEPTTTTTRACIANLFRLRDQRQQAGAQ